MKNKILIYFVFLLLVIFIISGCYQKEIIDIKKTITDKGKEDLKIDEEKQKEPFKDEDVYKCENDRECISISSGCCGCSAGGTATAINRDYYNYWNNKLSENCQDLSCIQVISSHWTCFAEPKCIDETCQLKPKKSDKTPEKVDYSNNNLSLVWNNKYSFVDKQITVVATADYPNGGLICTQLACGLEECCNTCSSTLVLRIDRTTALEISGPEEKGFYDGRSVGCDGDDCKVSCYPLEPGNEYLVTGILRKETISHLNVDLFHLELKNFGLV